MGRFEKLRRPDCIRGAHRVVVADGQNSEVEPFFPNQLHVGEQSSISRKVERMFRELQYEACRVAAITAIGER